MFLKPELVPNKDFFNIVMRNFPNIYGYLDIYFFMITIILVFLGFLNIHNL